MAQKLTAEVRKTALAKLAGAERIAVVGGDEILGLVRGLLYAGAHGALVTLWDVNDQSTADFMKLFYAALQTTPNKAQAFQRATAEIRRGYAHPYYWAPFFLMGNWQ